MKISLRVFIVDDCQPVAYTLCAIFRDRGYDALPYTDPQQALHDAKRLRPHLLISDVEMPVLDGVSLATQFLAWCPECKIILMSGHVGPIENLEAARAKGFDFPFFEKPVCAQSLLEKAQSLCRTF